MNNKKIISSILSISIMASLFVTPVARAATTAGLYANPDVYIEDNFNQAQALGSETRKGAQVYAATDKTTGAVEGEFVTDSDGNLVMGTVVTASGWDVTGGGYTTGKNSGGRFTLVANSTETPVVMTKNINEISSGMVRWEYTVKPYQSDSGFYGELLTAKGGSLVRIEFSDGVLKYRCKQGNITISKYSEDTTYQIISHIDLENDKVSVYLNGNCVGKDWNILPDSTIVKGKIYSKSGKIGTLNVQEFSVIRDYILYEDFNYIKYPKWWQAAVSEREALYNAAKLLPKDMVSTDISHGNVTTDDTVEFEYSFNSTELVNSKIMDIQEKRAYTNLLSSELANCTAGGVFKITTISNGNLVQAANSQLDYSTVTDSTAKDGKSIKFSPTAQPTGLSSGRTNIFTFTVPYEDVKDDDKFNLSFDIKRSSDLSLGITYDTLKDENGASIERIWTKGETLSSYRMHVNAVYTAANGTHGSVAAKINNGKIDSFWQNTPNYMMSDIWENTSYTFKLDHDYLKNTILAAAGEGATIKYLNVEVRANVGYGSYVENGSFWLDNISFATVKDSASALALNLTNDGKITLSANGVTTPISEYRANLWQHIRLTYDRRTGKATVRHNHLTENEVSNISVKNIAPENLIFINDSDSATITFARIHVKKVFDEPADYVPAPVVPADDGYYTSLLSCALWTESGGRGWDAISGYNERTSLLGFYDEGKPEVSDWEIKWMLEHGIDSQIFCWFDSDRYNVGGAIPAFKDAKYSDLLDYSLMWTNHGTEYIAKPGAAFQEVFRNIYVPYWIDNYFKDGNYTKIDGMPVLYVFSGAEMIQYLGGGDVDETLHQIEYLNQACKDAGFAGVKVFVYTGGDAITDDNEDDGKETDAHYGNVVGSFTYGYTEKSAGEMAVKYSTCSSSTNRSLPVLGLHHNTEAWSGTLDTYTTPAEFEQVAIAIKGYADTCNYSNMYTSINGDSSQKLVVLDNWNELGEGHFIMPTKTFGFEYLDIVRKVFSPSAGSHTDTVPTDNQRVRINKMYDQARLRRDGANTASSDKMHNFVAYWDFTDGSAKKIASNTYSLPDGRTMGIGAHLKGGITVTEGVGIQGTTNNGHDVIQISGVNINVDETGVDTVYIRSNQNVTFSTVLIRPYSGTSLWSNGPTYYTDFTDGAIVEQTVYMGNTKDWTGTVTDVLVRVPVTMGDDFTIEAIGLMKNNFFDKGDELVKDGSFEKGTCEYTLSDTVTAEVSHYDFNRGAESLKVTGNGTISFPVSGVDANGSYVVEAYAKLPFDDETASSLSAYLTYNVGGVVKNSDVITQPTVGDEGFVKLTGELEINELSDITDVALCIENSGGNVFYIDDVSLRRFDAIKDSSNSYSGNIHDGMILTFEEDVNVDGASAICKSGSRLGITKIDANTVKVDLPESSVGRDSIIISGITTVDAGQNVGIIAVDIYSDIDRIIEDYYIGDDFYTSEEVKTLGGKTITGNIQIENDSTTSVTGNIVSAFYKDNELLNVVFKQFTSKGNSPDVVEFEVKVPEAVTDYKVFVWSDNYEPLLK